MRAPAFATARGGVVWARALAFLEQGLAPLGLGAALSLTQAPASAWPILFCALPLALWLNDRVGDARGAARLGWLIGVGYFLPGLLWIGEAFLVEADRFAWMRPFAVTLLPMGLALFWALGFWAAARLSRGPASRALSLVVFWALAELARSHLLTGFPWGLFAFAWIDHPVAQSAAWMGPFALNTTTLFAASAPFWALLGLRRQVAPAVAGVALVLGFGGLITLSLLGADRLARAALADGGAVVRLVQPNTPQTEKWDPDYVDRNLRTLLALSGGPSESGAVDLVVWPETATPYSIETDAALRQAVMARMPEGAHLAYGALRVKTARDGGRRVFNSLLLVSPSPDAFLAGAYDKHHLVPFGEYLPFQETLEALGVFQLAGGRGAFSAGPGPQTLQVGDVPAFSPLICYEAIFPHERVPLAQRPAWLLQSTNDAWFGDSSGPWQHFAQARFRAIEQGLPLYRSANTGVSAGVDPYGRVLASLPLGARGAIDLPLVAPLAPTLYMRQGERLHWGILVVLAAAFVAMRAQDSRPSSGSRSP